MNATDLTQIPAKDRSSFKAARLSFVMSMIILAIKFYGFWLTGSAAIFSDASESIVNVISALLALWVMRAVEDPADTEHPYGHGKLEYFSSAFEGGLIAFAAIAISFGAIRSIIIQSPVHQIDQGMIVVICGAGLNFALGMYLLRVGKRNKSEALSASGLHVLSDVWTTLGVIVALFLVSLTGLMWIDGVVALLVALQLLYSGVSIVRKSIGGLLDEMDPTTLHKISAAFRDSRQEGLIDIHHVKLIRSGKFHHIDAHLVVPEYWDVGFAHNLANEFEKKVVQIYPFEGEIAFHIDPCKREYCESCNVTSCKIRVKAFKELRELDAQAIISGPLKDAYNAK